MNLELIPEHAGDWYISALKELHTQLNPATYFEIGTASGDTLALADCTSAAVDPHFKITRDVVGRKPACFCFQLISDEFFGRHNLTTILGNPVSLAFLDGMHHFEYLLRDFMNTEKHCGSDSVILLHDCLPTDRHVARRDSEDLSLAETSCHPGWWAGDVWKAAAIIRRLRPELVMFGINVPPTGLIAITKLNPRSEVLQNRYETEIARFDAALEQENTFGDFVNSLPMFSNTDLTDGGWLRRLFF